MGGQKKMNGRIHEEQSPEGRLAAVAKSVAVQMARRHHKTGVGPSEPDYADYLEALKPYVQRELLLARIDEARAAAGVRLTDRVRELSEKLMEMEKCIPKEFRL